jgi:secretion/DNA translocation related CpaE-like protein
VHIPCANVSESTGRVDAIPARLHRDDAGPMDLALPLVATSDDRILDDALRWCAAVGCTPEVATGIVAVRRSWRAAPIVVVGDDLAPELVRAQMPRRDHVLLLARSRDEATFPMAIALGAVDVLTGEDETRALDALTLALDGRGEACLVSLVGGVGGAGASTLAAALARTGADRGFHSLLLDADPLGGGLELVLGTEAVDGLRWHDLGAADGPVAAESLAEVLPRQDSLATLSWGRDGPDEVPAALGGVLAAALRGFDLVVADVPRHLEPAGVELVSRSVLTVVVVPEDVRAVGSARRVLDRLEPHTSAVAVVSTARPGGLGRQAVSEGLGRPVIARLRHDRHIRTAVDHGHGPGKSRSTRGVAHALLDLLGLDRASRPAARA